MARMEVATVQVVVEVAAMVVHEDTEFGIWASDLSGRGGRWAKEWSGKLQFTLRQSSESIRGTQKSDTLLKLKWEVLMLKETVLQAKTQPSVDLVSSLICDRCFPIFPFVYLKCVCAMCLWYQE